jgi:hypothetical protein
MTGCLEINRAPAPNMFLKRSRGCAAAWHEAGGGFVK